MTHVVMDSNWRPQYELTFGLIYIQMVTYRNIHRHVYTHKLR
jgi:hypothetical protein